MLSQKRVNNKAKGLCQRLVKQWQQRVDFGFKLPIMVYLDIFRFKLPTQC